MNKKFVFWAVLLIISMILMGLTMRVLSLQEVSVSVSLVIRGLSCLFLVIIFAYQKGLSLRPKSIRTQCIRAFIAGLALSLFSLSYNWLTASAISVLANIDVPLLIVFGPLVGIQVSSKLRLIAFISILFLAWYVLGLEQQSQLFYGLFTLMISCSLLCFGYLFIKKSMEEENQAITILVPSLAIIIYGLIGCLNTNEPLSLRSMEQLFLAILSGIGMFLAYIATMRLYAITDIAQAEFPTLISSLVIQPLEAVFLKVSLKMIYFFPSVVFVILTFYILKLQKNHA